MTCFSPIVLIHNKRGISPVETANPFQVHMSADNLHIFCGPNRAPRIGQPSHARNLRKPRKGPQVKTLAAYMQAKI